MLAHWLAPLLPIRSTAGDRAKQEDGISGTMVPLMLSASRAQREKPAGSPPSHCATRASRQTWRRPREEPDATHVLMLAEGREGIREPARGEDGLDALAAGLVTAHAREEQADAHVREDPGALRQAGILCQREAGSAPAGTSGRQTVLPGVFGVDDMGLLAMLSFDLLKISQIIEL